MRRSVRRAVRKGKPEVTGVEQVRFVRDILWKIGGSARMHTRAE